MFFKKPTIPLDEEPVKEQSVSKPIQVKDQIPPKVVEAPVKETPKPHKTLIIGLTGGIGSGKTTLANYIASKGIPVYISDLEAKKVMEFPEIIAKIKQTFNEEIIKEGKLDREKLASIVFNQPDKLKQLNAIVHPAVKAHFVNWVKANQNAPMVFKEAAILFESGSYKDCDAIVSVVAPIELRIQRVLQRDTTNKEKVLQRIHNQISDEERISRSQYVVENVDIESAKNQIDKIILLINRN